MSVLEDRNPCSGPDYPRFWTFPWDEATHPSLTPVQCKDPIEDNPGQNNSKKLVRQPLLSTRPSSSILVTRLRVRAVAVLDRHDLVNALVARADHFAELVTCIVSRLEDLRRVAAALLGIFGANVPVHPTKVSHHTQVPREGAFVEKET